MPVAAPDARCGRRLPGWSEPILTSIAAKVDGKACSGYIGGGAGHYVKMVQNGIEYASCSCSEVTTS